MGIEITGRHIDITEAMKAYAREKLERLAAEFPKVHSVHVILDVEKYRHIAEVIVHTKRHGQMDASETSSDLYVSIDGAVEKIEKQLRKLRDKIVDHRGGEKPAGSASE